METIPAKTLLTRKKDSSWFGTEYNLNLYRGCCHGCIYCDSRSDCYHIEDFSRVRAKADALRILRDELQRKVRSGVVATGSMSDPYNPFEGTELLTRHALELLDAFSFGVAIATKGTLITRDIDLLGSIREHSPVLCKITLTTDDDALAKRIEPASPSPTQRLEAIAALAQAGIPVGVLLMPVLPWITDGREQLLSLLGRIKEAGGRFVYCYPGVTLRAGQREYFYAQLDRSFPGLRARYESRYGERYSCTVSGAKGYWDLFSRTCDQLGLFYEMKDIISWYQMGYGSSQLSFFS